MIQQLLEDNGDDDDEEGGSGAIASRESQAKLYGSHNGECGYCKGKETRVSHLHIIYNITIMFALSYVYVTNDVC
jgi:hypothetical protein